MTTRDLVYAVTRWGKKTYMECAEAMFLDKQRWYRRLGGSMTLDEFMELLKVCGMTMNIVKDGEAWEPRLPHGKLFAKSRRKRYSTVSSRPLAYNGTQELFIDRDGDYFIADYQEGKVHAIDAESASRFAYSCENNVPKSIDK